MQTFGMGQSWKVWQAEMVLQDLHIWFNYQKATNDYHESNPKLLSDIGKRLTYIDQLQEFFCSATYYVVPHIHLEVLIKPDMTCLKGSIRHWRD